MSIACIGRGRDAGFPAPPAVGQDRGAVRASNDADVSTIPPIIPYGGFSPVRLQGWYFRRRLPRATVHSLSLLPAYADDSSVCFRPSCITWSPRESRSEPGRGLDNAPPRRMGSPPPQGPSLGSGLCCPGPSSLNRPHPPHSRAHRDFTASRLIRHAFAVRERLIDPRVVPGFRCPFFPGMPPSMTPGSSASA
jgi:hypothetical protein